MKADLYITVDHNNDRIEVYHDGHTKTFNIIKHNCLGPSSPQTKQMEEMIEYILGLLNETCTKNGLEGVVLERIDEDTTRTIAEW